MMSIEEFKKDI